MNSISKKPPSNAAPESGREFVNAFSRQPSAWGDPGATLKDALRQDHFILLRQPILPLKNGPAMAEVFVRLKEEEDSLLPPGGFFPVAEELGMMADIDRWVVGHLIAHIAEERRRSGTALTLYCNNVSSAALRSASFLGFVRESIAGAGIDGRNLCFEIDEAQIMEFPEQTGSFIAELTPRGCRFTIDSFGSVKGTFSQLRGLKFDFVKIDGVIVQNLLSNPGELARLRAILAVCGRLGISTIAELVEDPVTLACLRDVGVDYAQGFGVAPLVPLRIP